VMTEELVFGRVMVDCHSGAPIGVDATLSLMEPSSFTMAQIASLLHLKRGLMPSIPLWGALSIMGCIVA
jgi:hypothetical protein